MSVSTIRGSVRFGRAFWALSLLLVLVFAVGGSSRPDLPALIVIRPIGALLLGFALWNATRVQICRHRFIYGMAAATVALILLQLVPLPPSVWGMFPGRGLIAQIDEAAGLGAIWRPISLVPSASWNALFALLPPCATLFLSGRLENRDRWAIASLIIGIGLTSAMIAVLQLAGDPDGPLYFYRFTNQGSAVGLFANRNHQGIFLAALFPLLAACASAVRPSRIDARLRSLLAFAAGLFLIALILVTGSRNGLIALVFGLASVPFLYTLPGDKKRGKASVSRDRRRLIGVVIGASILVIATATLFFGRALSIERIMDFTSRGNIRYRAWGPMFDTAMTYFPIGGGFGAFADLFKINEPHALLATTIFAHAHNDWLELLITGGLPAALLLGIATFAFLRMAVRWWSLRAMRDEAFLLGGAGLWMVLILAVASVGDYPLRIPSLACLFCVIVLWISSLAPDRAAKTGV